MRYRTVILALLLSPLWYTDNSYAGKTAGDNPLALHYADLPHELRIITGTRSYLFRVDIRNTRIGRNRGLQHIRSMPDDGGMLFVFPYPMRTTFWMKNTPQALDILFIGDDGVIKHIVPNTQPYSTDYLHSEYRVPYVLEIKAGLTKSLKIYAGHKVILPHSPKMTADE